MFPLAHAWLLARVVPKPTPAHYLGCVWPDMLFDSPLSHPQSHRSGAALAAYAQSLADAEDAATLRAFVTGVLTHGSEPHGFDWYSDEEYGAADPLSRSEEDFPAHLGIVAQLAGRMIGRRCPASRCVW